MSDLYIDPPPFSFEVLEELFQYDDGLLRWKVNRGIVGNHKVKGKVAGTLRNGYVFIKIGSKAVQAHKIIWMLHHKTWPREIDHINGISDDNRVENLEPVTHAENNRRSNARRVYSTSLSRMRRKLNEQRI